ncbi:MAG: metallophosphoesterase [Hyphomicrobiales bacterium]
MLARSPLARPVTRRGALLAPLAGGIAGLTVNGYAFAYAPGVLLDVTRYRLTPEQWRSGPSLRIAVLTDLHFGEPFVSLERLHEIVETTNGLQPDLICLLGDFEPGHRFISREVPRADWARALATLKAPLGVHTVLGNHDWWADARAQSRQTAVPLAARALLDAGLPVMENSAVPLVKDDKPFWLIGLGDQIAYHRRGYGFKGRDDLRGALAAVPPDGAPALLLAHEPDIFPQVPHRVALTLSGHTHGGQVRLFGYSPLVPSSYGNRYAYGHVEEGGRHLVVSGGIGPGKLPIRIGVPPEIVLVELTAPV